MPLVSLTLALSVPHVVYSAFALQFNRFCLAISISEWQPSLSEQAISSLLNNMYHKLRKCGAGFSIISDEISVSGKANDILIISELASLQLTDIYTFTLSFLSSFLQSWSEVCGDMQYKLSRVDPEKMVSSNLLIRLIQNQLPST